MVGGDLTGVDGAGSSRDSDMDRKRDSDRRFTETGVAAANCFSLREEDLKNKENYNYLNHILNFFSYRAWKTTIKLQVGEV